MFAMFLPKHRLQAVCYAHGQGKTLTHEEQRGFHCQVSREQAIRFFLCTVFDNLNWTNMWPDMIAMISTDAQADLMFNRWCVCTGFVASGLANIIKPFGPDSGCATTPGPEVWRAYDMKKEDMFISHFQQMVQTFFLKLFRHEFGEPIRRNAGGGGGT